MQNKKLKQTKVATELRVSFISTVSYFLHCQDAKRTPWYWPPWRYHTNS